MINTTDLIPWSSQALISFTQLLKVHVNWICCTLSNPSMEACTTEITSSPRPCLIVFPSYPGNSILEIMHRKLADVRFSESQRLYILWVILHQGDGSIIWSGNLYPPSVLLACLFVCSGNICELGGRGGEWGELHALCWSNSDHFIPNPISPRPTTTWRFIDGPSCSTSDQQDFMLIWCWVCFVYNGRYHCNGQSTQTPQCYLEFR